MNEEPKRPYGLRFVGAVRASELEERQIVVLDGHVVDARPDPADPERVRLVLVRALGPPPGTAPDQREIEISCPRDMLFGTAVADHLELAPLPARD
jgi:hypothetical protein